MGLPFISVIVCTYQRRDMVCDALRTISAIDYAGEAEVIVVVDGSTDGTAEALAAIDCPFPLQVLEQANAGAAAARNRGAAQASGEILLFLDDDMLASPDLLTHHARAHAEGADAVLGAIPIADDSPSGFLARGVRQWIEERSRRLAEGGALEVDDLLTGQLSVRRSLFEALGGFDTAFTANGSFGNEDLDFGLRLIARHRVDYCPQAISHQRYIVTPAQNLRQWRDAGAADVALALKHPGEAQRLWNQRGGSRWSRRLMVRPLAALPGLTRTFERTAAFLSQRLAGDNWFLDRVAGRLFYGVRELSYWAGVRSAGGFPRSRRLTILCLHAVADLSGDPVLADYGLRPERLARLLDRLLARGFRFISGDHLAAALTKGACFQDKAILLTFDDGYAELPEVARTILVPRSIPAIAFAVSGVASASNEWDQAIGARQLALLNREGLRKLASLGAEIGCHSRQHRELAGLDSAALDDETAGAARDLAEWGLPAPRYFAYPYGISDKQAEAAVARAGFLAGFGLAEGRRDNRMCLPRIEVKAGDSGLALAFRMWRHRATIREVSGAA